jgi:hypothetical protein
MGKRAIQIGQIPPGIERISDSDRIEPAVILHHWHITENGKESAMSRKSPYLIFSLTLIAVLAVTSTVSRSAEQWYEDTYETDQYDDQAGVDWGEYEWDPSTGLHEEEWYDPSDWFDDDEGVEYEDYGPLGRDDRGYYDYGYDYGLYDGYTYWDYGYGYDDYGYDYDYGWDFDAGDEDNYHTDDWDETNDAFGDWYDAD